MKVVLFCGGYGMRMRDGVSDLREHDGAGPAVGQEMVAGLR